MKKIYVGLVLLMMLAPVMGWGQTVFLFSFENTETVTTDNAVGTPTFTTQGLLGQSYVGGSSGQSTSYNSWTAADYARFTVNTTGYSGLNFSFYDRTSNTAIGTFKVRVSPDGTSWTDIVTAYTPSTSTIFTQRSGTLPASCNNQATVYIDIYKITTASNTSYTYRIDEALLSTTGPSITLSPATQNLGPFCSNVNNNVSLTYTIAGTVTAPYLELSNSSGSFASGTTNIGTTVTGSGTYTISGTIPSGTTAGTYRLRVVSTDATPVISNNNGSDIMLASSAPAAPGTITQPGTTPCAGSTGNTYSISAVSGATSYTWSVTGTGWSVTAGGTTTSATITAGSGVGTVSVVANNGCGASTSTSTGNITPNAVPATPGTITQPGTTPCTGSTGNAYSIAAVSGATSYTWSVTGTGWSVTAGGTTTNATITAGTGIGTVSVVANNTCGSSGSSSTGNITPATVLSAATATAASVVSGSGFTANWNAVIGASGYQLDIYRNNVTVTDDFTDGNFTATPVWSGSTGSYAIQTAGTLPSGNASTDASYLGSNSNVNNTSLYTASTEVNEWNFSLGSPAFDPSATNYFGVVLMSSAVLPTDIATGSFNGYYLRIGTGGSTDNIELWRSTATTKTMVGSFSVSPDLDPNGLMDGLNIRITRSAAGVFQLYYSTGFIFAATPTTNGGTVTDNTYNTSSYFGIYTRFTDASTTRRVYIDNITLGSISYVVQNQAVSDVFYEATGLTANQTYYYVVRAVNYCGSSANSNVISVTTTLPCTPTATITSFAPATGPTGTLVTITGTGFTGATAVKFGTLAATTFTVVSSTKIIAETPANTPTDLISITVSACDAVSATSFTPITQTTDCGNISGTATNLFISEVYDGEDGSLSYIEIFNGTASAINLATGNYDLRIITGTSTITDIPLTGTINSGAVFVVRLGDSDPNNGTGCGAIYGQTSSNGGFNGNDRIYLGTLISSTFTPLDYVPNPNYPGSANPGFSQARKSTSIGPSTTYIASDWTIATTEDCSHLGIAPYTLNGTTVTINTQPQDENDCSAISFTVLATSNPASIPANGYLWKYFNAVTGTWDNASDITNATIGITASNTNTLTMTISGNTAQIYDYQFYCEVTKNSCTVATNAVQYTYNTRLYYRNTGSGNWSNPAIWQMSSDSTNWTGATSACMYPTKENSSGVFIQSPYTVTQNIDINIDYLFIKPGGILTTSLNSQLITSDSTTGADFVVGGTWNYDANSANSWAPDVSTGAWKLGAAGSIIKTNSGSSQNLRDYYDGGMSTIPSTANWTIRYGGTDVTFTTTGNTYYPNLTFESNSGLWAPSNAQSRFTGNSGYVTVKGNLDIGGAGTGTVTVTNENTNAQPMLVNGNVTVLANNTITTAGTADGTGYEIKGNVTVNGTLTAISNSTGILKLSGNTNQNISGTGTINLQDVTIANTGGAVVQLNKDITIPGVLTSSDGSNLNLTTGNITLKSTAVATARVAPINTGVIGYGTGEFIVERNVAALRSWRLLSVPVVTNQTMRQAWMEGAAPSTTAPLFNQDPVPGYGMHISGPSPLTNGFDETPLNNYSVKYHNGSNWVGTGIQPDTSHLRFKQGWMTFVRGPRGTYTISTTTSGTTPQTTTLRTKGQVYTGTQPTINIVGATVIGNPYPSAVNFNSITKAGTDVYYIWDPRIASGTSGQAVGGWITMVKNGLGTYTPTPLRATASIDTITGRIESGQAFVVKNFNITSLNFKELDKATGSNLVFRPHSNMPVDKTGTLRANLYVKNNDGSLSLFDGVMHMFSKGYSSKVDSEDALKLIGFAENLCISSGDSLLSVEKRNTLTDEDTLRYRFKQLQFRNYSFEFVADKILSNNLKGYIEDKFMQTTTPLNAAGSTTYDFSITSDSGSYSIDRFRIVFKQQVKFSDITAHENRMDIDVTWKMDAVNGVKTFEVEHSADGKNFKTEGYVTVTAGKQYQWRDEAPVRGLNYYKVKAINENGEIVYSDIAETKFVRNAAAFIYPNPVRDNIIRLQMGTMPKGKYSAVLTGTNGIRITTIEFNYHGAGASQAIKTAQSLAPGVYQLELSGSGNTKSLLKVLVE